VRHAKPWVCRSCWLIVCSFAGVVEFANVAAWYTSSRSSLAADAERLEAELAVAVMMQGQPVPNTNAAAASARTEAMRITVAECTHLAHMRRNRSEQSGATATNKFIAGLRKLIDPQNVTDGRGSHLLAHRLVAMAAAAAARMCHIHGTVGTEQGNLRTYHTASAAGRKSFELLVDIAEMNFLIYLRTFWAKIESELRPSGQRREVDRKLKVSLDQV
jgi:hypothetical protein